MRRTVAKIRKISDDDGIVPGSVQAPMSSCS